jgi:hypothetical protein
MFSLFIVIWLSILFGRKIWPARIQCSRRSSNRCSSLLTNLFNHFQLAIQVSKDGIPGRVPLWVILLSAFAGLLLLMLLILALWKVSFKSLWLYSRLQQGGEIYYDLPMLWNLALYSNERNIEMNFKMIFRHVHSFL